MSKSLLSHLIYPGIFCAGSNRKNTKPLLIPMTYDNVHVILFYFIVLNVFAFSK